jgi:hypothetical protein
MILCPSPSSFRIVLCHQSRTTGYIPVPGHLFALFKPLVDSFACHLVSTIELNQARSTDNANFSHRFVLHTLRFTLSRQAPTGFSGQQFGKVVSSRDQASSLGI